MTQGARICPHCKRRVDERRAKGLAYCLSCGQPLAGFAATSAPPSLRPNPASQLGGPPSQYGAAQSQYGTPPPSQYGGALPPSHYGAPAPQYGAPPPGAMPTYPIQPQIQQQKGSGALGLIIGIVIGVGGLLAIVIAVVIVLVGRSSSSSSSSSTAVDDTPTSTVAIETPTASADDTKTPTPTAPTAHHPKPPGSSSGKVGEDTTPPTTGTQAFPTTRALEKLDDTVTAAEHACAHSEGPFGSTLVEVTFQPDGRTETLLHLPIAGTPEGNCISAEFLSIRLGPFEGARRTFSRSLTMRPPAIPTTPTATSTSHTGKPDAGH